MPPQERYRVFAYGTLLVPEVMETVTGRPHPSTDATLAGYSHLRVRGECFPGLVPNPARRTEGVLYLHVDKQTLETLDRFEGELYERRTVEVETEVGGTLEAETYVIKAGKRKVLGKYPWDVDRFCREDLESFLERCRRFREGL